jgi:CDP-diacylglycerol--glycerol-3-phosphate 3-phosphatidyltransferase
MSKFGLDFLEPPMYRLTNGMVRWMIRMGIHPNVVTTLGFLTTVAAGISFHLDHVRMAGFLVLIGGLWDLVDGRVARESGLASKFGSFYDSTLDRVSEMVMWIGLASLYNTIHPEPRDLVMIYVIMAAMGGSVLVSYTRARAEGLGLDCKVGFMQRAERVVLLGGAAWWFGLDFDGVVLTGVIIIVAILTNVTAIQRIVWVFQHGAGVPLDDGLSGGSTPVKGNGDSSEETT